MRKELFYIVLLVPALVAGCGGGGGGGGTGPDPEPPVIVSGPAASNIGEGSATVTWRTDTDSESEVAYGLTSAYGDTVSMAAMTRDHSVVLTGLNHSETYHYRVSSKDGDGLSVSSGDRTLTTLSPAPRLVGEGWEFFEAAELDSALARFDLALSFEPDNVGAFEGRGWTYFYLYMFVESLTALEQALSAEPDRIDCLVALAFLYEATEEYEDAVDTAREALNAGGGTYVFDYDDDITASDVRYSLIISLVGTGDLTGALSEARILDPSIDLDPANAATWDGHSSFEEALLALIESLKSQI